MGDATNRRAHDAYHRFPRDGVWHLAVLWRAVAAIAVNLAYPPGTRVQLAVDETALSAVGPRIKGVGVLRDPVRSIRNRLICGLGLNLAVISLRIDPPWPDPAMELPTKARFRPRNETGGRRTAACGQRSRPFGRPRMPTTATDSCCRPARRP